MVFLAFGPSLPFQTHFMPLPSLFTMIYIKIFFSPSHTAYSLSPLRPHNVLFVLINLCFI